MYLCKFLPSKQSIIYSQFVETIWFQMKQHKFQCKNISFIMPVSGVYKRMV